MLGAPPNPSLGDECEQYEAFVEALPPFDVALPPPPSRMRFAGFKDQPPAFPSVEVAFPAHLLSLDRAGSTSSPLRARFGPSLKLDGMSGSPLISTTGTAMAWSAPKYRRLSCKWPAQLASARAKVLSNRKLGPFGEGPMLDDDALLTIAENLARLKLSPLLHLKIAVAVVAPLITPTSEASTSTAQGEKAVEPTRSKESRRTAKAPKGQIRRADGTFAAKGNGAGEGKRGTPTSSTLAD